MIALALAGDPDVLIADEATSALDVVTQTGSSSCSTASAGERGMGLLLISHDSRLSRACWTDLVMYAGGIVEEGPDSRIFSTPSIPTPKCSCPCPGRSATARGRGDISPIPPAAECGCSVQSQRCRLARVASCAGSAPPLIHLTGSRRVRCPVAVERPRGRLP